MINFICFITGWYRGEESNEVCYLTNSAATDWPFKQLLFYMVDPTKRRSGKNAPQLVYPGIPSVAPVPHCRELPVPTPPKKDQPFSEDSSKSDTEDDVGDPDYGFTDAVEGRRPYLPNHKDVNDFIRDIGLSKSNAELLTSRLKQWNLLDESVQVIDQRARHQTFSSFLNHQARLCFCNNVTGLFETIGITYNPS